MAQACKILYVATETFKLPGSIRSARTTCLSATWTLRGEDAGSEAMAVDKVEPLDREELSEPTEPCV